MSDLYGDNHRRLQDQFDSRRLADRLETTIVKQALDAADTAFVSSRDMFFLSTIDHQGRPTLSYKGGDPGFVTIVDDRTIAFPSYDGNGMFLSMGNILGNPEVGMLFIDFEHPNRLRLQGRASIQSNDPLLAEYREAELIVRVAIQQAWVNCPRYIHRYTKQQASRHVPREHANTPLAEWKRIDAMQEVVPAKDAARVAAEGSMISPQQYGELLSRGDI